MQYLQPYFSFVLYNQSFIFICIISMNILALKVLVNICTYMFFKIKSTIKYYLKDF
jgi:hypothetical protein